MSTSAAIVTAFAPTASLPAASFTAAPTPTLAIAVGAVSRPALGFAVAAPPLTGTSRGHSARATIALVPSRPTPCAAAARGVGIVD